AARTRASTSTPAECACLARSTRTESRDAPFPGDPAWGAYNRYRPRPSQNRIWAKSLFLEGDSESPRKLRGCRECADPRLDLRVPARAPRTARAALRSASPGVHEAHVPGESPADRALRLALEKADAVARAHPQAIVIGADQVAACAGELLDKP